jgi:hypothetical protein
MMSRLYMTPREWFRGWLCSHQGTWYAIVCSIFHGRKWQKLHVLRPGEVCGIDPAVEYHCPVCVTNRVSRMWMTEEDVRWAAEHDLLTEIFGSNHC